jgi:acyl-CoA thioester hydrolase
MRQDLRGRDAPRYFKKRMSTDHLSSYTTTEYRVPYADSDQMGVVYYANYFVYFERLRNEVLRNIGYLYTEMEADGLGLPIVEAHCDYKLPAHYDDLLTVIGWFERGKGIRLWANCEVRRDGELLASGYTVHVCVDLETGKPQALPERLAAKL